MSSSPPRRGRRACALVSAATLVAAVTGAAAVPAATSLPAQAPTETVERVYGPDRYGTAAAVAAQYPDGVEVVYVASGEVFPDALTARAAAATSGDLSLQADGAGVAAPVLLTRPDRLPQATRDALSDLGPVEIRVVGGTGAVSEAVEDALGAYGDVTRISGRNRYGTAAEIAGMFPAGLPVVFLASGEDFPDALVGGAVAGALGVPILLTRADSLSDETAAALRDLAPQSVVVLGGAGAVSETVLTAVTGIVPETTRVAGRDRYATAALLAADYPADLDNAFVATGLAYPDALTGSALAGFLGQPLLLTRAEEMPAATSAALQSLSPQGVTVLGGPGAVGAGVVGELDAALPGWVDQSVLQLLSFNDYHGHLEAGDDTRLSVTQDPDQNLVGGAEFLATTLAALRGTSLPDQTMTVAAGDLIGGSPFLSGLFHDEPSVESLNLMGLDVSSVGNHEFDEGVEELLRMQEGGCHPVDGCYFPGEPYAGADFPWLAANVVDNTTGDPVLPATYTREVAGVDVGFIGMTLEDTPTLVNPAGVASVDFLDEVATANSQAAELQAAGVESIVVLLHEGGFQTGTYNDCVGISGPVVDIANGLDPAIDMVVTGHTHQPYVCSIADPAGDPRLVTSANQYGRVVTETDLVLSSSTGDVVRDVTSATNHLVTRDLGAEPAMTALIDKWSALADVVGDEVVGTVAEDITGDAGGDRGIETPMANLVADSILAATAAPEDGGAQISFMNVGGVRASLTVDQISGGEQPGEVTYAEAFAVTPFNNIIVSVDMTGAQIKAALEQQFVPTRGRPTLALGVSEGFSYTWDATQPQGSRVSDMQLNGSALVDGQTYRVSLYNFLADGGDSFTAFTQGTNRLGAGEDLEAFVTYLRDNPQLTAPGDRVTGL